MYEIVVRGGGIMYERADKNNKFFSRSEGGSKNDCKVLSIYDKELGFCEFSFINKRALVGIVARLFGYSQRIDTIKQEELNRINEIVDKMKFKVKPLFISQVYARYIPGSRPNAASQESAYLYKFKKEYLDKYESSGCKNASEFVSKLEGGYQDRVFSPTKISIRARCGNNTGGRGRIAFKVHTDFSIVIDEYFVLEFNEAIKNGMNIAHYNCDGYSELKEVDDVQGDLVSLEDCKVKVSWKNTVKGDKDKS